jgi:hypothetical protein
VDWTADYDGTGQMMSVIWLQMFLWGRTGHNGIKALAGQDKLFILGSATCLI